MNTLNLDELDQVSGGSFAYDVGRVMRFIYLMGPQGHTTGLAVADWMLVASLP